jgi:hypothetical protein
MKLYLSCALKIYCVYYKRRGILASYEEFPMEGKVPLFIIFNLQMTQSSSHKLTLEVLGSENQHCNHIVVLLVRR